MTARIRELTEPEQVRALGPMLLDYFRIVTGELAREGVEIAPGQLVADMMETLEKYVPPLGRAYVAEKDGVLLAMAFLKPLTGQDVELKRLYVSEAARGTGLGRRMLSYTIEAARGLGKTAMYLDTIHGLQAAIALYEAEGFRHIVAYEGSEVAASDEIRPHAVFMMKPI